MIQYFSEAISYFPLSSVTFRVIFSTLNSSYGRKVASSNCDCLLSCTDSAGESHCVWFFLKSKKEVFRRPLQISSCLIGQNWVTCPFLNQSLTRGMGSFSYQPVPSWTCGWDQLLCTAWAMCIKIKVGLLSEIEHGNRFPDG